MALSGRMATGLNPRQLQEGLNKILDESLVHVYEGPHEKIFPTKSHKKIIFEIQKLAGMGPAGQKGEGVAISNYDSVDQVWTYTPRLLTYEKSARITLEAQHYNLYMDLLPRIGKELAKAHKIRKDIECANVLINAFDTAYTYGDGKALCVSDHPVQYGGTISNVLTQDFDEDALEAARVRIYGFVNDDGQLGNYEPKKLVYPTNLMHEVERVLKSSLQPNTANNDINVNKDLGDISEKIMWKRLSDTDSFYILTNHEDGFCLAESMGVTMKEFAENFTWDTVVSTIAMWVPIVLDSPRAIVGSAGV